MALVTPPSSSPLLPHSSSLQQIQANLDLSHHPPIFVSATHFDTEELHDLEEALVKAGAILTYDLSEANIVLSKVNKKMRIMFDLRANGLWIDEAESPSEVAQGMQPVDDHTRPRKKRRVELSADRGRNANDAIVVDDESTVSEVDDNDSIADRNEPPEASGTEITVLRAAWFKESCRAGHPLPLKDFVTFRGRRTKKLPTTLATNSDTADIPNKPVTVKTTTATATNPVSSMQILERAKEDASQRRPGPTWRRGKRFSGYRAGPSKKDASWASGHGNSSQYAHLQHHSSIEHDEDYSSELPEMPQWVKEGAKYACQRSTPAHQPNGAFIALLEKIKLARALTNDEVGVRAYSTSIASLAAYPRKISNPREIVALPGCDAKIASLFDEWANTGRIQAVEDLEADEDLKVLRLLSQIWGVGPTTAREFYYDRGWRDLDDIVEYGWKAINRVQQIGVKYYEEFLDLIPRAEVAEIGRIIHRHAVRVRDDKVQSLIVGGYRRGKEACGDVDIVVSHPEEEQTRNIVNDIVVSLEDEGWITHTLLLSLISTHRGQQTLPFRTGGGGHGFDTLDKALVVWQDPTWPSKEGDLGADPDAKNPNIHRRVDIIISPWRTVGCAVAGWSGGTTFQRDLRRYSKNVKGWKFDSSGVRDRRNGEVLDLEGWSGGFGHKERAKTMEQAERRVFEGMGLVYREPWERCTG